MTSIQYLDSGVGSGKTAAIIRSIKKTPDMPHIYVVPSTKLADEIESRILKEMINLPDIRDVKKVNSATVLKNESVFQTALTEIAIASPDTILILCTQSFERLLTNQAAKTKLKQVHVILDEGINANEVVETFIDSDKVGQLNSLFTQENDNLELNLSKFTTIKQIADGNLKDAKDFRSLASDKHIQNLCTKALTGCYDIQGRITNGGKVELIVALKPEALRAIGKTTFIVANFKSTVLGKSLDNQIELEPMLDDRLFDTHSEKGHLISIGYLLNENDTASRATLDYNLDGKTIREHCSEFVCNYFNDQPFIYTLNSYIKDDLSEGVRIPVNNMGIDEYKRFNNVAVLATQNPQPWVSRAISNLIQGDCSEVYSTLRNEQTYQTVGRTSLRVRDSNHPIQMIVLDKPTADYLLGLFENSTNLGQLTNLDSIRELKRQKKNKGIEYTRADNSAYSKYKKRIELKGEEPLAKDIWYTTIRTA